MEKEEKHGAIRIQYDSEERTILLYFLENEDLILLDNSMKLVSEGYVKEIHYLKIMELLYASKTIIYLKDKNGYFEEVHDFSINLKDILSKQTVIDFVDENNSTLKNIHFLFHPEEELEENVGYGKPQITSF